VQAADLPAELTQLRQQQRGRRGRTGDREQPLDGRRGQCRQNARATGDRSRALRVSVDADQCRRRHPTKHVDLRIELAKRREERRGSRVVGQNGSVDDNELASADRFRDVRQRRQLHDAQRCRHLIRSGQRPARPAPQNPLRVLPVPGEHAAVGTGDRVEPELERGDHTEVAATAAQRPEQVGLGGGIDTTDAAVGGDDLGAGDAVGLQAELAGEPAQAAPEGVAGDADVRRRPVQRGQPVRGRRHDGRSHHTGANRGDLTLRVDHHRGHRRGAQQHGVVQRGGDGRAL
jgi:hypothetical protein